MARVLIYVQHLLGVGHLKRAALIGRALAGKGLQVTLVSGGMPVPGLDPRSPDMQSLTLEQLPPARVADESFHTLVDEHGRPVDDAWRERRRVRLLEIYSQIQPAVLIIEHFPFGRRHLQFELLPLLALLDKARANNSRPWVLCSVRDILVRASRPERYEEMVALANAHFDRVLVHGDESLIPFGRTFPLCAKLSPELIHTGYVVDLATQAPGLPELDLSKQRRPSTVPEGEVLVSSGSRQLGEPLVAAALEARPLTKLAQLPWRILTGLHFPRKRLLELQARSGPGVVLENFRADYCKLLSRAALSISQGGYNTTMEVIAAGIPAVLMPYKSEDDQEQALRAQLLGERGAIVLADGPDAQSLARAVDQAVDKAMTHAPERIDGVDTAGAESTARIIMELAGKQPPSA